MCPVLQVFKKRNYSTKQAEKVTFAFQAYPWHTHAAFDCLKWYETASFSKRVHAKNLRLWDARGFEISGRHFRGPLGGVWRGGGGGVRMSLVWISNTVVSHFEEKTMSLSVFNQSLCRLSPFHLIHSSVRDAVKPYPVVLPPQSTQW